MNNYQFNLNGLLMNGGAGLSSGSSISITEVDGLDHPDANALVSVRSNSHGSYVTARYHKERVIVVNGRINMADPSYYAADTNELKRYFQTTASTVQLSFQLPGVEQQYVNVQPVGVRFAMKNVETAVGMVDFIGTVIAPDPRIYSSAGNTTGAFTSSTITSGGVAFPKAFPFSFNAGSSGGVGFQPVYNQGNTTAPLVIRFDGPLVNPKITNTTTGESIQIVFSLNSGDYLLIDTLAHTVLLNGVTSRYSTLTSTSTFIELPIGSSTLNFTADSGAGTATVTWNDTWI